MISCVIFNHDKEDPSMLVVPSPAAISWCVDCGFLCILNLDLLLVPDMSAGLNGASSRSSSGFLHPPLPQGHPSAHSMPPPMQGVRGYNVNHPSQVAAPSHQIPVISSSNTGINHFQDIVEAGSSFLAPIPPMNFRSYRPPRREIILDSYARHPNFPQMRVLPEDVTFLLPLPPPPCSICTLDLT